MGDSKNNESFDQTKRIMERLVKTPPKPHKPVKDSLTESNNKNGDGPIAKRDRRHRTSQSQTD